MKPEKCDFANFEYVFNWVVDIMKKFMQGELYDEKRVKFIRDAATIIFTSYEKELIGKTNDPPYKPETLEKIINCREEIINILDKFETGGANIESNMENIRCKLRTLNK